MPTKAELTADFVDSLLPPENGEIWVGDVNLPHFGVRAWASKNGGNKCFAIRLRNKLGRLVRESYNPSRDWDKYVWRQGWTKSLGFFVDQARWWGRNRIAFHLGEQTFDDWQRRSAEKRQKRVLQMKLGKLLQKRMSSLRKKSKKPQYVAHIEDLINQNIDISLLETPFGDINGRALAVAITDPKIPFASVRRLRAFVTRAFKALPPTYGYAPQLIDEVQEHCRDIIERQTEPRFPEILSI